MSNFGHHDHSASGRGASSEGLTVERVAFLDSMRINVGSGRIGPAELAKLLRCSVRTARRRLAEWHSAAKGTAPAVGIRSDHRRRGRSSYFTTRPELVRFYPEIDDG